MWHLVYYRLRTTAQFRVSGGVSDAETLLVCLCFTSSLCIFPACFLSLPVFSYLIGFCTLKLFCWTTLVRLNLCSLFFFIDFQPPLVSLSLITFILHTWPHLPHSVSSAGIWVNLTLNREHNIDRTVAVNSEKLRYLLHKQDCFHTCSQTDVFQ